MSSKTISWLRWIPAVLFMAMIFLFSNQPGGESGTLSKVILDFLHSIGLDFRAWFGTNAIFVIRKTAHFTEYFILFWLVLLAFGNFRSNRWKILVVCILYAASDEFHQLFIPGRVGNVGDVMIDSAGAIFGFLIRSVPIFLRKRP
jgi:VanZ family protein